MKNILLLVIGLCFIPFLSYSEEGEMDTIETIIQNNLSEYVRLLQEGDYEGLQRVRRNISSFTAHEARIKKVMKKTFTPASYGNEDNILHFIVRLEQSDALKETGDYRGLIPEIEFIFYGLGPKLFSRLLVQKNKRGRSSADEARVSGGLAYEALRTFFIDYRSSFAPSYSQFVGGTVLTGFGGIGALTALFEHGSPEMGMALAGMGFFAGGVALCWNSFTKDVNFREMRQSLAEIGRPLP